MQPNLIFSYLLRNKEARLWHLVDEWIHEIDRDFDHVMILEEIDDSLAVLMLKFCWDIDDMVHLKVIKLFYNLLINQLAKCNDWKGKDFEQGVLEKSKGTQLGRLSTLQLLQKQIAQRK